MYHYEFRNEISTTFLCLLVFDMNGEYLIIIYLRWYWLWILQVIWSRDEVGMKSLAAPASPSSQRCYRSERRSPMSTTAALRSDRENRVTRVFFHRHCLTTTWKLFKIGGHPQKKEMEEPKNPINRVRVPKIDQDICGFRTMFGSNKGSLPLRCYPMKRVSQPSCYHFSLFPCFKRRFFLVAFATNLTSPTSTKLDHAGPPYLWRPGFGSNLCSSDSFGCFDFFPLA